MLTSLWILIKAKAFNLFCPIVLRMNFLRRRRVDIDLSQVHVVTGMVPKIRIAVRILGNDNSSTQEVTLQEKLGEVPCSWST